MLRRGKHVLRPRGVTTDVLARNGWKLSECPHESWAWYKSAMSFKPNTNILSAPPFSKRESTANEDAILGSRKEGHPAPLRKEPAVPWNSRPCIAVHGSSVSCYGAQQLVGRTPHSTAEYQQHDGNPAAAQQGPHPVQYDLHFALTGDISLRDMWLQRFMKVAQASACPNVLIGIVATYPHHRVVSNKRSRAFAT